MTGCVAMCSWRAASAGPITCSWISTAWIERLGYPVRPMTVVTRFAPSPTGMLHIGGVRTALFSWLYARHHGGKFILRVEDTDRERSTDEAVRVILDGMRWLGLNEDEGPFYQTRRYDRYREVIQQFLDQGLAYRCYCTKQELDAMRENQLANKEKPRYDGRWRDSKETPPAGVVPPSASAIPWKAKWWLMISYTAAPCSRTPSSTISSSSARTATPPTTSAWWWMTGTWA